MLLAEQLVQDAHHRLLLRRRIDAVGKVPLLLFFRTHPLGLLFGRLLGGQRCGLFLLGLDLPWRGAALTREWLRHKVLAESRVGFRARAAPSGRISSLADLTLTCTAVLNVRVGDGSGRRCRNRCRRLDLLLRRRSGDTPPTCPIPCWTGAGWELNSTARGGMAPA